MGSFQDRSLIQHVWYFYYLNFFTTDVAHSWGLADSKCILEVIISFLCLLYAQVFSAQGWDRIWTLLHSSMLTRCSLLSQLLMLTYLNLKVQNPAGFSTYICKWAFCRHSLGDAAPVCLVILDIEKGVWQNQFWHTFFV